MGKDKVSSEILRFLKSGIIVTLSAQNQWFVSLDFVKAINMVLFSHSPISNEYKTFVVGDVFKSTHGSGLHLYG